MDYDAHRAKVRASLKPINSKEDFMEHMKRKRASEISRLSEAEDLLRRLLKWETDVFGGSEARVWSDVRSFFGEEIDEEDESICQDDDFCNCGCNALT